MSDNNGVVAGVDIAFTVEQRVAVADAEVGGHDAGHVQVPYVAGVAIVGTDESVHLRDIHLTDAEGTLAEVSGQHVERERIGDHE